MVWYVCSFARLPGARLILATPKKLSSKSFLLIPSSLRLVRRILDGLFLGDLADATDLELLERRGIGAVLNLLGQLGMA